jgi:CBS domain-containing protein
MTSPVVWVPASVPLTEVAHLLERASISCVPVLSPSGAALGAVSRTDLLRAGRREAAGHGSPLVALSSRVAGEVPARALVVVPASASASVAAQHMVRERVHRVFVEDEGVLSGVFSTKDLLLAIHDARVRTPVDDVMSRPAFTIPVDATLAQATDRLGAAHVTGLAVVDPDGWPVGTFTQADALAAKDRPGEAPLEDVMSYSLACVHTGTPLFRAAAITRATRARRALVIEDRRVIGIVTGLDFARAVAV